MTIPFTAIITAAAPVIGRYLQQSAAKDQAEAEARAQRIAGANEVLQRVSEHMNGLVFYQEQAMWGAVSDRRGDARLIAEDEANWNAYNQLLFSWKKSRISDLANVTYYFGDAAGALFIEVNKGINTLERQVGAAHYGRTKSAFYIEDKPGTPNDFRTKFFNIHTLVSNNVLQLCTSMIRNIEDLSNPPKKSGWF